jgi:DNA-binding response OmpR family regulator
MIMHALVIEPQVYTSFTIEDALREAGFTSVTLVTTEDEAVAAAQAERPDLITAAVQLASGSGIAAVKKIRAKLDAPVLFITDKIAELGRDLPGVPYVRKPFHFAALPAAISAACSGDCTGAVE